MFNRSNKGMGEIKTRRLIVHNSILIEEVAKLISEGDSVALTAKGRSMLPFIKDRDTVVLVKADNVKLYDIVLAQINNKYVLHRLIGIKNNEYTLMGDGNLKECESCSVDNIVAVAIKIRKRDKEYNCRDNSHIIKAKIWNVLRPVRKYLLAIYNFLCNFKYENS